MSSDRNVHQKAQQAPSVRHAWEGDASISRLFSEIEGSDFLRGAWPEEDYALSRHFALQFKDQVGGYEPDTQYVHAISPA